MMPRTTYLSTAPIRKNYPAIIGTHRTVVAIVGAGFTGLSSALHLRERGVDVSVLEAHEPGWGASGRNGGQVNPGFKHDPDEVDADFGPEWGDRLNQLSGAAPGYTFDLITRLGIDCEAARTGTLRVVKNEVGARQLVAVAEQWAKRGAQLRVLKASDLRTATGTGVYCAGLLDDRGGNINPFSYSVGLAKAVYERGGKIFSNSRIDSLTREGGKWIARTPQGAVEAEVVVLATNGYSGPVFPAVRDSLIPVYSAIAATAALPAHVAQYVLPGRPSVYESAHAGVFYFRVDKQLRLLMGGPSPLHDTTRPRDFHRLVRYGKRLFPDLQQVEWDAFWNGQVAVTRDCYPRLHEPAPGLIAAFGYSGRGIAMATTMGRIVTERICGLPRKDLDFPITEVCTLRFRRWWKPVVSCRLKWGVIRDAWAR
jgi:glycine/D-amino acid oxidase-like deaminating enzyme